MRSEQYVLMEDAAYLASTQDCSLSQAAVEDVPSWTLRAANVRIEQKPTDQPWGHRTLFFRDSDGNVLEIYTEI